MTLNVFIYFYNNNMIIIIIIYKINYNEDECYLFVSESKNFNHLRKQDDLVDDYNLKLDIILYCCVYTYICAHTLLIVS